MQLTKKELLKEIAQKTNQTQKATEETLLALSEVVKDNLDKVIVIPGIARLKPVTRAARKGVNPATKEKIDIPAKKTISLKAEKSLLEGLNLN